MVGKSIMSALATLACASLVSSCVDSAHGVSAHQQGGSLRAAPGPAPNANVNVKANANAVNTPPNSVQGKGTNPLVIKGYRFFDSVTGEYVGFRGVNYYPRPNTGGLDLNNLDLFTSEFKHIWGRDLPEFVALSANSIRLYAVDPEEDHTEFMCALQAAGIYVIVDLGANCPGCEITPDEAPACYPASYKSRGERIIRNFAKYDNVVAFSGGNEINHRTGGNPPQWNAPCQKKFVRDMRAFIKSCPDMRQIPMGLVVADTHRDENALYYNCLTDPTDELENAEWYGINVYVHCDNIDDPKKAAGFNMLRDSFNSYNYSIPTILTEFGCLSLGFPTVDGYEGQRTHHQAKWMNSPEYSEFFNGGFVFEYNTENANSKSTSEYPFTKYGPQNYGLGYLSRENCDDVNIPCDFVRMPNFHNLAQVYAETDTSSEPTIDEFQINPARTQRSQCPAHFPKLKDFVWEGDSAASEACPTVNRIQCPNVPLNLKSRAREVNEMPRETPSNAPTPTATEPSATQAVREQKPINDITANVNEGNDDDVSVEEENVASSTEPQDPPTSAQDPVYHAPEEESVAYTPAEDSTSDKVTKPTITQTPKSSAEQAQWSSLVGICSVILTMCMHEG